MSDSETERILKVSYSSEDDQNSISTREVGILDVMQELYGESGLNPDESVQPGGHEVIFYIAG